jgi:signal transduction histidine kinase
MNSAEAITSTSTVLIVDDSRSIRSLVSGLLSASGYTVLVAANGEEGLELVRSRDVDIVLLDIEMPGLNGFQVLERLSLEPRLFAVIMFTTLSGVDKIVEALNQGADDYITKPFREDELLARVAAASRSVAMKRALQHARHLEAEALAKLQMAQTRLIEEQKMQAIALLAAGFAHEINNPLGYMQSNAATLRRYAAYLCECADACLSTDGAASQPGLPAGDPVASVPDLRRVRRLRGEIEPMLGEIQEGCARIAYIVQCFARLEQGLASSQVRVEDLNLIVSGVLNQFRPILPPTVVFRTELTEGPLPVMVNLSLINVVLVNLLQNAADVVGETGEICVRTGRDADLICCHVANTGTRIGGDILKRAFDPFFSTKDSAHHPGLGLTVARCFITAQGGSIAIDSPDEEGVVVTVTLPAVGQSADSGLTAGVS